MGYDLHIERQPPGGWKKWNAEHTPVALQQKLSATEDDELQFKISEQIRATLAREKAAVGLLITTAEWIKAVQETPGIRLATKDANLKTSTGDVLSFKHRPEDVEVLAQDGDWRMAILFRRGTATFSGRAWEPGHPVAIAACRLAKATHAKIVGDEGEEYPLLPGAEGARKSG
jgi:hypothetical protein